MVGSLGDGDVWLGPATCQLVCFAIFWQDLTPLIPSTHHYFKIIIAAFLEFLPNGTKEKV